MVSEKAVRQALYQTLNVASVTSQLGSGSASLVDEQAPPTSLYPLCVFWKASGVAMDAFGKEAFRDQLWGVKGVVKAKSASVAEDIDKAAYDLLNFVAITVSGAVAVRPVRESDISFSESEGDEVWKHRGGLYRLKVQTT